MRSITLAATVALGLAGCARAGGNETNNQVNVAAEEGIEDLNAAVSGDELTIDPAAADDMANSSAQAPKPANATR